MQHTDLISKQVLLMNELLKENFPPEHFKLLSADRSKIQFSFYGFKLIFDYTPDQYEKSNYMLQKNMLICGTINPTKAYPVSSIVSFLKNDYKSLEQNKQFIGLRGQMEMLKELLTLLNQNRYIDWEKKYDAYLTQKYKDRSSYK